MALLWRHPLDMQILSDCCGTSAGGRCTPAFDTVERHGHVLPSCSRSHKSPQVIYLKSSFDNVSTTLATRSTTLLWKISNFQKSPYDIVPNRRTLRASFGVWSGLVDHRCCYHRRPLQSTSVLLCSSRRNTSEITVRRGLKHVCYIRTHTFTDLWWCFFHMWACRTSLYIP